jgi:xylose isomerase
MRVSGIEELARPTLDDGESAASLLQSDGDLGVEIAEESDRLGERGYAHVHLNQLALRHLLGAV